MRLTIMVTRVLDDVFEFYAPDSGWGIFLA